MRQKHKTQARILVVDDASRRRQALGRVLGKAGYDVVQTGKASDAPGLLKRRRFDAVLLDLDLRDRSGFDLLRRIRKLHPAPRVVVMTSDGTPETLLRAVREQVVEFVSKPLSPEAIVEVVRRALAAAPASLPIEVVSALPAWVELVVPCALEVADRIQSFMLRLEADLPDDVRESVGHAFRELLLNAIEWGGKLDARRKVRVSYLRFQRMLLYRIADPGRGFRLEGLTHSAVTNPNDRPLDHAVVREEKGLRPGGFGIYLVRSMVDELVYNETHNEVVFVKYLD